MQAANQILGSTGQRGELTTSLPLRDRSFTVQSRCRESRCVPKDALEAEFDHSSPSPVPIVLLATLLPTGS